MRRSAVFLFLILAVAISRFRHESRPKVADMSVHEALVMTFEEMAPADRAKIRSRFASSQAFGRVSWRNGKLYCFLTQPGQEVAREFVEERLDGKWKIATFQHERSLPIFGTLSGTKSRR